MFTYDVTQEAYSDYGKERKFKQTTRASWIGNVLPKTTNVQSNIQ